MSIGIVISSPDETHKLRRFRKLVDNPMFP